MQIRISIKILVSPNIHKVFQEKGVYPDATKGLINRLTQYLEKPAQGFNGVTVLPSWKEERLFQGNAISATLELQLLEGQSFKQGTPREIVNIVNSVLGQGATLVVPTGSVIVHPSDEIFTFYE